jgi:Phage tail-collar fibre protein
MTAPAPIKAVLTTAGLAAALAASNSGIAVRISHIALGWGRPGPQPGYAPADSQTALYAECVRAPVGGADRLDAATIVVQAALDPPAAGWAHEIGVFLDDGTLFALHAATDGPLTYVQPGIQVIYALALGLQALPAGAVSWQASGPQVNILMSGPFASLALGLMHTQTAVMTGEIARHLPRATLLEDL